MSDDPALGRWTVCRECGNRYCETDGECGECADAQAEYDRDLKRRE